MWANINYLCEKCKWRVRIDSYLYEYKELEAIIFECNCGISFRGVYKNELEEHLKKNPHLYRLMTSQEIKEYEKKLRKYEKKQREVEEEGWQYEREEDLREMFNQEEIDIEITNIELEQLELGA